VCFGFFPKNFSNWDYKNRQELYFVTNYLKNFWARAKNGKKQKEFSQESRARASQTQRHTWYNQNPKISHKL
jgi:hypothetical protein